MIYQEKNAIVVLPSYTACEPQQRLAWQDILIGAIVTYSLGANQSLSDWTYNLGICSWHCKPSQMPMAREIRGSRGETITAIFQISEWFVPTF